MGFFKDGLSVDETKISVMMLGFVVTLGFSMYQVVDGEDISENVLTLLGYLIMAISGINIADKVGSVINKKSAKKESNNTEIGE